jgi:hypothetical protein
MTATAYRKAVKAGDLPAAVFFNEMKKAKAAKTPGVGCFCGPIGAAPKYGKKGRKTSRKGCRANS